MLMLSVTVCSESICAGSIVQGTGFVQWDDNLASPCRANGLTLKWLHDLPLSWPPLVEREDPSW